MASRYNTYVMKSMICTIALFVRLKENSHALFIVNCLAMEQIEFPFSTMIFAFLFSCVIIYAYHRLFLGFSPCLDCCLSRLLGLHSTHIKEETCRRTLDLRRQNIISLLVYFSFVYQSSSSQSSSKSQSLFYFPDWQLLF